MSRRIRLLHVLEATEGGTRTHLRDLVLRADRDRFAVDVAVSLRRDPSFADDLARFRAAGVGVYRCDMVRQPHPAADLAALRWLRRLIRAGGYDIVHAHSSKAGFLGRLAARLDGVSVRLYTPNAFHFLNPEVGRLERAMTVRLERLAAGWGTHLIAVSEGEREAAVRFGVTTLDRITVIPNGIDLARLDAEGDGTGRAVMGVGDEAFVVLTIGRRATQKGDRHLLEAWPNVLRSRPEAVLVLVGDGPLLGTLRARAEALGISASLRWLSRQSNVGRLYQAADAYVLPSLYEGCPYSVMEAMACGLPVVATQVEGSRDLLDDGRTGLLVPPADSGALAAAMTRIATDAPLCERLGAAAREEARREFGVATMVSRTEALYRRLLGTAP